MTETTTNPITALAASLAGVVVGQERVLDRLLACTLARGHALLEGPPGVGKTMTLTALAASVGGTFSRIQCTPDLLPSDITGTRVYRASTETFTVEPGPVFANFVLVDEINRAPAKVQSALLEVMAERQVSIGRETLHAPDPFLVLATQNPLESKGTFALPEAQRDRFMMRIMVPNPTATEEMAILQRARVATPQAHQVLPLEVLRSLQNAVHQVAVPDPVADYIVRITMATRDPATAGLHDLCDAFAYGASPRATLAMDRAARALALVRGRTAVSCQDVFDVAFDVLNHRIGVSFEAQAEGMTTSDICHTLLANVTAPHGW